jgi:hypothetical protein
MQINRKKDNTEGEMRGSQSLDIKVVRNEAIDCNNMGQVTEFCDESNYTSGFIKDGKFRDHPVNQ